MEQIKCIDLAIGYDRLIVQKNINLSIEKGDFVALIGNNGSGKTTFMKTVLNLQSPLSGKIVLPKGIKATDFAYLPQQTQRQKDFPASVWEVTLSGHISKHAFRPFYTKAEKQKTLELLERVGIAQLKNTSYSKLSTGQQQRTLLARALCSLNKIIFLDEPTSALDPLSTQEMYTLFQELNNSGLSIVMVTHDVENSLKYVNKVVLFDKDVKCLNKKEYLENYCSCALHTSGV